MGRVVTMEDIAGAIGITRQALSDLEHNRTWPSRSTMTSLCALYGMQPGELLVYEDRLSLQTAPALQVQPTGG
jgi:transcriptional regulator with XRE-family HTH domain